LLGFVVCDVCVSNNQINGYSYIAQTRD